MFEDCGELQIWRRAIEEALSLASFLPRLFLLTFAHLPICVFENSGESSKELGACHWLELELEHAASSGQASSSAYGSYAYGGLGHWGAGTASSTAPRAQLPLPLPLGSHFPQPH